MSAHLRAGRQVIGMTTRLHKMVDGIPRTVIGVDLHAAINEPFSDCLRVCLNADDDGMGWQTAHGVAQKLLPLPESRWIGAIVIEELNGVFIVCPRPDEDGHDEFIRAAHRVFPSLISIFDNGHSVTSPDAMSTDVTVQP